MEIPFGMLVKFKRSWCGDAQTGKKSTISKSGKVKKDKVVISILLQILTRALDKKYESCCELIIINIISVSYKKIMVPNIFSSTSDKSWPLRII
jgi:hypothetical protein